MKEYGVQKSWVKEYVLHWAISSSFNLFLSWCCNSQVMKLWNGELLFKCANELGYYAPDKGAFKPIAVHGICDVEYGTPQLPIIHLGSLFSPKNVHKLRKRGQRYKGRDQQTGERSAHNQANETRKTAQPQANTTGSNTHPKKPGKPANKESQAEKQGQNASKEPQP